MRRSERDQAVQRMRIAVARAAQRKRIQRKRGLCLRRPGELNACMSASRGTDDAGS